MAERLRALLERPLDPAACRAVVVVACALTIGFGALVTLSSGGGGRGPAASAPPSSAERPAGPAPKAPGAPGLSRGHAGPQQDPQDRPGSGAHLRAGRELAAHRALQHVPYRRGGVTIELVGARGERAVLAVRAADIVAVHRGWRAFLRRFHDVGRAYLPRFEAGGGRRRG